MFDQKIFQLLSAIQKSGSLIQAAYFLHVSQPYLSKLIKQYEDEYKIELVTHYQRPLQLTDAGNKILEHLKKQQEIDQELRQELLNQKEMKPLRVAINQILGEIILPDLWPILTSISSKIDLIETATLQNQNVLGNDLVDALVVIEPFDQIYDFNKIPLAASQLYYLASPSSPLFNQDQFDFQKIPVNRLILPTTEMSVNNRIEQLLSENKINHLDPILRTGSLRTAANLVVNNVGDTFINAELIPEYQDKQVNILPVNQELQTVLITKNQELLAKISEGKP